MISKRIKKDIDINFWVIVVIAWLFSMMGIISRDDVWLVPTLTLLAGAVILLVARWTG